jgi:translation initiation factor 3 subunit G
VLQKSLVEHAVAERKLWSKFGAERGNRAGPDRTTTTVGEEVSLKIAAGNKSAEVEPTPEQIMKANLAKAGKVVCRLCKGDHYTAKCPYKDSLAGLDGVFMKLFTHCTLTLRPDSLALEDAAPPADSGTAAPGGAGRPGVYVPPSMRAGGGGRGESMFRGGGSRDDLPTLRVTNVSEDTTENDLRDLFNAFGRVARVYVGRDRETGAGKGYAFVSFEDRAVAQRAMEKVHGMGYDNLILNCQWSQPREPR